MTPGMILLNLRLKWLWIMISHIALSVPSTNDWAKFNIDSALIQGNDVYIAHQQTKGRGRYGKTWWSPEGMGLYASFVKKYNQIDTDMLTTWLGHGIVTVLKKYTLLDIHQEGINDIYLDKRKLGGILCEVYKDYLIVGVGLNLFRPTKVRKDLLQSAVWMNEYGSEQRISINILIDLLAGVIFK